MLKKAGYVTAQFGKLDWGFTTWHGELQRHGWDHYVGYMDHVRAHGYYPSFLWKNGERLPLEGNTHADAGKTPENYSQGATEKRRGKREGKVTYAPDVMLRETLKFMEKNRKKPMFIFFSTNLPHGPVDIPPAENIYARNPEIRKAYTNASGGNKECGAAEEEYASMVDKLDRQVEAIVAQVHKLGLEKRTMIIFASDNGHEIYYRTDKGRGRSLDYHGGVVDKNGELLDVFRGNRGKVGLKNAMVNLAGLKWTNHEGGIRVPMIVSWPGTLPHGKVCHSLVAITTTWPPLPTWRGVRMPAGKGRRLLQKHAAGQTGPIEGLHRHRPHDHHRRRLETDQKKRPVAPVPDQQGPGRKEQSGGKTAGTAPGHLQKGSGQSAERQVIGRNPRCFPFLSSFLLVETSPFRR